QRLDRAHRRPGDATRRARMADVPAQQPLDDAPDDRHPGERERESREAVEGDLRAPGGRSAGPERGREALLVRLERRGAAREDVERRLGGEARAQEALVHAVTGERVDEACGVADEERVASRERRPGAAERQAVAAQALDPGVVDPMTRAELS